MERIEDEPEEMIEQEEEEIVIPEEIVDNKKTNLINKIIELQEAVADILYLKTGRYINPSSIQTRRHLYNNFKIARLEPIYNEYLNLMARIMSKN